MAFSGFLKIDGIEGESTDEKHTGQIEILGYKHRMAQSGGAVTSRTGGQTGSRVDIDDFEITKVVDKSSPPLHVYCANGKHIPSIVLELTSADEQAHTYMKYTLSDCVVASVNPSGQTSDEGSRPTEDIEFRFAKIEWEYTPFDNKGKPGAAVKAGWDAAANKSV